MQASQRWREQVDHVMVGAREGGKRDCQMCNFRDTQRKLLEIKKKVAATTPFREGFFPHGEKKKKKRGRD